MGNIAKLLISIGVLFIIMGLFTWLFGGLFSWFGKLPGDIRIQNGNFSFYAPITSMIIISLILNLLLYIFSKL